jgi:Ca-activated chloride channel family protein
MLGRKIARSLAHSLFALAAAQAALTGCNAKDAARNADRQASAPPAEEATASGEGDRGGVAAGTAVGGSTAGPAAGDGLVKDAEKADGKKEAAAPVAPKTATASGVGQGGAIAASPGVPRGRIQAAAPADPQSGEAYNDHGVNAWTDTASDKLSTFAADVDTASFTIARRKLNDGALPHPHSVRVEEFVNYFSYGYAPPDAAAAKHRPFAVHMDAAPSPFNKGRHLVRVGVTTKAKSVGERKPANLVFLVDVSGSMQSPDKLDLARRSLRVLVDNLKDGDTVSLVTYAGATRVVLEPTGLDDKHRILAAIEDLTAGGSTAMASGLELAYQQAAKGLRGDAISRVIVLSDGDANVGRTSHEEILKTIEGHVKEGVTLSTVGFGTGNYKDALMEQLADKGNGNAFYIDGISAAHRVFQQQLGSTLEVVAKDVKLQVEWSDKLVKRYRLVGYENRDVADTDFRNDAVDAGEIGAGHQVTAIYEIELASGALTADLSPSDLATVRVRHKAPKGTDAAEAAFDFPADGLAASFAAASADLRFAFAVAAFAEILRGSEDAEHWDLAAVRQIASDAAGADPDRAELVAMIDQAIALKGGPKTAMAR